MNDLIYLFGELADLSGHIKIPGIYDRVDPVTEAERRLYDTIDFDLVRGFVQIVNIRNDAQGEYQKDVRAPKLLHDNKMDLLMHRWRHPSLSMHGR
jgi:hypothetical protein